MQIRLFSIEKVRVRFPDLLEHGDAKSESRDVV